MRSVVIILGTVFVLVGGFGVYWWMQRDGPGISRSTKSRVIEPPRPTPGGGVGEASGVWLSQIDKAGRRTSRVKAEQYDPISPDRVRLKSPVIEFFLRDGQVIRVSGRSGIVVLQQGMGADKMGVNLSGMPTRGSLRDVTVELFPSMALAARQRPSVTLEMEHASFDSEALKVQTEEQTDPVTKKIVPWTQAPVTAHGDYEFEGRGLEIRWNARDHRLDFLKVFHGKRLVVHDADAVLGQRPKPERAGHERAALPIALASADKKSAAGAIKASTPAPPRRSDESATLYRATFRDNVHVTRGDELEATAEVMQVDFRPRASTQPTNEPGGEAEVPVHRSAHGTRATTATRPLREKPVKPRATPKATKPSRGTSPPTTGPTTAATTQEADEPVVVTWTGPLVIVPVDAESSEHIASGDAVVRLTGSPVRLSRERMATTCGEVLFRTSDRSFELEESRGFDVVMHDAEGASLRTPRLTFARQERVANLYGASSAVMPVKQAASQPADPLTAKWSQRCTLTFDEDAEGRLAISRAELRGDVAVRHAQVVLDSRVLTLGFEQPATQPARGPVPSPTSRPWSDTRTTVREIDARDDVHCELVDERGGRQVIDADHLKVLTHAAPDGSTYPQQVIADGKVRTSDAQRELRAEYLSMTLAPTTRPASAPATSPADGRAPRVELHSLLAHENVRVKTADGGTASGDQLVVRAEEGTNTVKILGQPAVVTRQQTTLTGPILQFNPRTQHASVLGAGTLRTVQEARTGEPGRPVEVKWQTGLNADGLANQVDCLGNVVATVTQADGTVEQARGERARLLLVDVPATQPATRVATRPASGPASMLGEQAMLVNKAVRQVTLLDKAQVSSTLLDPRGTLLQGAQLDAAQIDYEVKTQRVIVPLPGSMTLEDHRPAATRPATTAATGPASRRADDLRGQTGIVWEKHMDYDPASGRAVVEGNVRIGHIGQGQDGRKLQMQGDRFVADLVQRDAVAQAGQRPRADMKHLRGEGSIIFLTAGIHLEAESIDYSPANKVLTIRGGPRKRVRQLFSDGQFKGLEMATFDEVEFDTEKWQLQNAKNPVFTPLRPVKTPP